MRSSPAPQRVARPLRQEESVRDRLPGGDGKQVHHPVGLADDPAARQGHTRSAQRRWRRRLSGRDLDVIPQAWERIVGFDQVLLCTSSAHEPGSLDLDDARAPGYREIAAGIADHPGAMTAAHPTLYPVNPAPRRLLCRFRG